MSVKEAVRRTASPHHVVWFYLAFPLGMYALGYGTMGGIFMALNLTIVVWMVNNARKARVAANDEGEVHPWSP